MSDSATGYGNPFAMVPTKARKWVYGLFATVALVLAAIEVGFSSAGAADPLWLVVSGDVIQYLAIPVGALAISNVNRDSKQSPEDGG